MTRPTDRLIRPFFKPPFIKVSALANDLTCFMTAILVNDLIFRCFLSNFLSSGPSAPRRPLGGPSAAPRRPLGGPGEGQNHATL